MNRIRAYERDLRTLIRLQRIQGQNVDLKIISRSGVSLAHTAVLSHLHPYWEGILAELATSEENFGVVMMPDTDHDEVEQWLDQLYLPSGSKEVVTQRKQVVTQKKRSLSQRKACEICSKTFKSKASFYSHMLEHKPEKWSIKCAACPTKSFKTSRHLAMHNAKEHGVKSLVCLQCGKSYSTDANLRCHVIASHNNSQFPCEDCGKVFASKVYLKAHQKLHNKDSDLGKTCPKCGRLFKGRYYYQHLQLHSPSKWKHKCTHCPEKFQSRYKMLEHESLFHTGLAQFPCDKCNQLFLTSARRAVHKRSCQKILN